MRSRTTCAVAILVLAASGWAQCPAGTPGACGDCDQNGTVDILDSIRAARLALSAGPVTLAALWSACNVNGDETISVIDALKIAQVSVGLQIPLRCNVGFRYGLFVEYTRRWGAQVIADSYDSSAGPYSATASWPWSEPYARSKVALGTNGTVDLSNPGNELHGLVFHGAGQSVYVAGTLGNPPCELAQPEVWLPVPQSVISQAQLDNDNGLINSESTADPAWFTPGSFEPYDAVRGDLYAFGPGTRIVLGDPGGGPRTYFFRTVSVHEGIIEFVGPTTVFLDGFVVADSSDGVGNWVSRLPPRDVLIVGTEYAQAIEFDFDLVNGFAGTIYAPESYLGFAQGPRQDFFGSIVCRNLSRDAPAVFAIHYDESLAHARWP